MDPIVQARLARDRRIAILRQQRAVVQQQAADANRNAAALNRLRRLDLLRVRRPNRNNHSDLVTNAGVNIHNTSIVEAPEEVVTLSDHTSPSVVEDSVSSESFLRQTADANSSIVENLHHEILFPDYLRNSERSSIMDIANISYGSLDY
ncbi:hypothetical protein COLO4_37747 [Corchorus olitorius]|uniref:Uncharacterized protein n=1 Tax=Corchorus olitorius TaxID=93759 RepID=A0A1R3FZL9_9ROSI|nr:hypothetical protein COLO4_37747 [Corchorus olitorius]